MHLGILYTIQQICENTADITQTRWALLEASITGARFTGVGWMWDTGRPCSWSMLVFTWKSTAQQTYQIHSHGMHATSPLSIYTVTPVLTATQSS